MASGLIGEAILIISSVIVAGAIAGVVLSQIGVFESSITETTEAQQDKKKKKIDIVYGTGTVAMATPEASIFVKNTGSNPLVDNTKFDVYFGPIGSVKRYSYQVGGGDDTWEFVPAAPSVWQQKETYQINVTESDLATSTTYEVQITTPNGVSDDFIFSISP